MKKFYKYIDIEKQNGYDIQFGFYHNEGPACANYKTMSVFINNFFVYSRDIGFDENAMIGVLYHEIGHLEYYKNNPVSKDTFNEKYKTDSEYHAFEFSLIKLLDIAIHGDLEPLKSSIVKLNERIVKIKNNNLEGEESSHSLALDLISDSEIYKQCCNYVGFTNN